MSDSSPSSWAICRIGDLATEVRYGTSAKTSSDSSGVPVLRMGNIVDGKLDLEKLKYLPANHEEFPILLLDPGDVLFNRTNSAELVGKTAVYKGSPTRCSFASYLIRVRLEGTLPAWLSFYLNCPLGKSQIKDVVSQNVGQANVNGTKLKDFTIPLPPLNEQKRIVAKIEELFSELDAGEESLRQARRQLGVYRQSLLKQAFEGKLTGTQFAEDGRNQQWQTMTIKEACENIKVGIVIQPKQYYTKDEDGIKAFRSANVREFRIEDSNWVNFSRSGNDANPRTQLKTDDVLIVRSGYPGTSCVVTPAFEGCNAIDILIATPDQQVLRSDFLCAFNNSPLAKGLFSTGSRGVAQKHLNVGVYSALTIRVPPLPEQQEIVRLLDEQFTVIEQNERELDAALKRSEALRQSILKKAFTGHLVPRDPTDEPAKELLARIREEREEAILLAKKTVKKTTQKSKKSTKSSKKFT